MRIPIEMQQLGPDLESAIIVGWEVTIGDPVAPGDVICEVETDKITTDLVALDGGVLVEIVATPGTEVPVGGLIGYLEAPDA